jgi:hypothetical protein
MDDLKQADQVKNFHNSRMALGWVILIVALGVGGYGVITGKDPAGGEWGLFPTIGLLAGITFPIWTFITSPKKLKNSLRIHSTKNPVDVPCVVERKNHDGGDSYYIFLRGEKLFEACYCNWRVMIEEPEKQQLNPLVGRETNLGIFFDNDGTPVLVKIEDSLFELSGCRVVRNRWDL